MGPKKKQSIVAFDLYGTLLSTDSIAEELAKRFGNEKAASLATLWRRVQLEYTWRSNSMQYCMPFERITRRALDHALKEMALELSPEDSRTVMTAYNSLSVFPDVSPALMALAQESSIIPVIFSNGSREMIEKSVKGSPDLSLHAGIFHKIVTAGAVSRYKPDPQVYYYLAKEFGRAGDMHGTHGMWLVSSNPFDIVGARFAGMNACWIDRAGNGWVDMLMDGNMEAGGGKPNAIVRSLEEAIQVVKT